MGIMDRGKPKGVEIDIEEPEEGADEEAHEMTAMEGLMSAMKSGDAAKALKAFQALHDFCASSEEEPESKEAE